MKIDPGWIKHGILKLAGADEPNEMVMHSETAAQIRAAPARDDIELTRDGFNLHGIKVTSQNALEKHMVALKRDGRLVGVVNLKKPPR